MLCLLKMHAGHVGQVLTHFRCHYWSVSLGRKYVIALIPSKRSRVGVVRQVEKSHLGSKVHHCVNVVLSEQVADQVRALNIALDQLHDKYRLERPQGTSFAASTCCVTGCEQSIDKSASSPRSWGSF